MRFLILTSVILLSWVAAAAAQPASAPRGARSVYLNYPAPEAEMLYNEVTVEASHPGSYFQVCGFSRGYFGIQDFGTKRKKLVLFSVWDEGQTHDAKAVPEAQRVQVLAQGTGVRIERFGGEGTGGKCLFDYDWQTGQTYRFLVKSTQGEGRTAFAGYFYLNETKSWKHLVTFDTPSKGERLRGLYSFIEDFRRDGLTPNEARRARYGNGWVLSTKGAWSPLLQAKFDGDSTPLENVDAFVAEERFVLMTGGAIKNTTPLGSTLTRSPLDVPLPK